MLYTTNVQIQRHATNILCLGKQFSKKVPVFSSELPIFGINKNLQL